MKGFLGRNNPYTTFLSLFVRYLTNNGICDVEDLTFKETYSCTWLGELMREVDPMFAECVVDMNEGYNTAFSISHSQRRLDKSLVAWRVIRVHHDEGV